MLRSERSLTPTPRPGTRIGRFVLAEQVGAGAAGQVFAAHDLDLDRRVAIKLLKAEVSAANQATAPTTEAKTLARFSHSNVVPVFATGVWNGRTYLCMEFVTGGTMREWVATQRPELRHIVSRFIDAGAGLGAAHALGVIHRDFKPDNILIRADGRALVTDFGLSTAPPIAFDSSEPVGSTATGSRGGGLIGTPAYMAPDQLRGLPADAASDQFSFCVALYEMAFGARPFVGATVGELLRSIEAGTPSAPLRSHRARKLRRVLARGLSANAQSRYPSLQELLDALRGLVTGASLAGWGLVAAAVVAVALVGFGVTRDRMTNGCDLSTSRFDAAWNSARAQSLGEAFAATGLSFSLKSSAQVAVALNEQTARLRSQWQEACGYVSRREDQSGYWSRKLACIDESSVELASTVSVLLQPTAELVAEAPALVASLANARTCGIDTNRPADSATSDRRQRLVAAAATAAAMLEAGRVKDAQSTLESVPASIRDGPAIAPFDLQRALVRAQLEGPAKAEPSLVSTALSASQSQEWLEATLAYLELSVQSVSRLQLVQALSWVAHARATSGHLHNAFLTARLDAFEAGVALRQGDFLNALKLSNRAQETLRQLTGPENLLARRARIEHANVLREVGHVDEAIAILQETAAALESSLGGQHPLTLSARGARALAIDQLGKHEEALAETQKVLEAFEETGAPAARVLAWKNNLATLLLNAGRPREAEVLIDDVVNRSDFVFGRESTAMASFMETSGSTKLILGNVAEAGQAAERGLEICRRLPCLAGNEGLLWALKARVFMRQNHAAEAKIAAGRAEALFEAIPNGGGQWRLAPLRAWKREQGWPGQ